MNAILHRSLSKWWLTLQRRGPAKRLSAARRRRDRSTFRPRSEELENRQLLSAANLFSSALPIDINSGRAVAGNLRTTPTFYSFDVSDGGRLVADVLLAGGASRLTLLSADGVVLMQSDGQSPTNPNDHIDLHFTGPAEVKTYYLEVQGLGDSSGSYALTTSYVLTTAPFQRLPVGDHPWGSIGDFNGDGILDIATANKWSDDVSVLLGQGDGTFGLETRYPLIGRPTDLLIADLNGDGILDLATPSYRDSNLSILKGKGDGTFEPATEMIVGGGPYGLKAGDFNNDGRVDLAFVDAYSFQVVVLLGEKGGGYAAPISTALTLEPDDLTVGDFNKDGLLDVATVDSTGNTATILLGRGDGRFFDPTTRQVGGEPFSISSADVDSDGFLDLVTADGTTGTVTILFGSATGIFDQSLTPQAAIGVTAVAAADFNNDGRIDLVATNYYDGTLSVFLNRGGRTFDSQTLVIVGDTPSFVAVGDLNHDGQMDVINGSSNGIVAISLGKGDGTFLTPERPVEPRGTYDVAAGDLNLDGFTDLVTVDYYTGKAHILLGRDDGTFRQYGEYDNGHTIMAAAVGDFNEDGVPDLVLSNFFTDDLTVSLGKGDGTFGAPSVFQAGPHPYSIVDADFNGDGHLDIATSNYDSNDVALLLGTGQGTFADTRFLRTGGGPTFLAVGDFNNDHVLDIVTANYQSNDVSVLFGQETLVPGVAQPQTSFAAPVTLAAGKHPSTVVVGDFNGDGVVDLAVSNYGDWTVSVFLSSPGTAAGFLEQAVYQVGAGTTGLTVGHFNGDPFLDLLSADYDGNTLTLLPGTGDGSFGPAQTSSGGNLPIVAVTVNLNHDQIDDVAVANYGSGDVSVFLGGSNGVFSNETRVSTTNGPDAIAAADFNNDGIPDLATVSFASGNVSVQLGQDGLSYRAPVDVAAGNGPIAVAVGDFNHDGRADLAVADRIGNSVTILLGIGDGTFTTGIALPVGSQPSDLVVRDFDGDGNLDVAVPNCGSSFVSVLWGTSRGTFKEQRFTAAKGISTLAAADMDGDGRLDLIAGNEFDKSVSVQLGQSGREFVMLRSFVLPVSPSSLAVADFNGDGLPDIAVASEAGDAVYVLLAHSGTFFVGAELASAGGPIAVVAGDFDHDGHQDLAIASNNAGTVTVWLGQGGGAFQMQKPFAAGSYPSALVAADFNLDGRLDIVTANSWGGPFSVGLGLGTGAFVEPGKVFSLIQAQPIVADLTGDGLPDVVVLRRDGKILFRPGQADSVGAFGAAVIINPDPTWDARDISVGQGKGTFFLVATNARVGSLGFYMYVGGKFRMVPTANIPGIVPAHILVGDVNGDGLQDVILNLAQPGQILVFLQHQNEDFSNRAAPDYVMQLEGHVSAITLADVNGDHLPDILVSDQSFGVIRAFLNSATAPFTSQVCFRAGTGLMQVDGSSQLIASDTPVAMVVGQFNADAIPDLAVLNSDANRVDILLGDGHGGMFNPATTTALLTGLDPGAIVTGDFNGDGRQDLAVLNRRSDDLSIFLGDGKGGFIDRATTNGDGLQVHVSAGNSPTGLAVADINGDGKLDLIVGNVQGDVLTVLGNGDGTFRPYQRIDRHVGLAITDVNSEQGPGIALANQSLDQITYQDGEARSTFVQGRQDGVVAPQTVKFADLNGDGTDDLIIANSGSNTILVYLGLGNDQFGPAHRSFVGTQPTGVTVSDLNGDGIPDLVVANENSNDVSVLFGQGQGAAWTFTPGPRLNAGAGPLMTVVRDINGDGVPDILVANSVSNDVFLLPGLGQGFFDDTNPRIFQTGNDPAQLFVGNFDGQAGLDLVTLNTGSNDLTFFSGFGSGRTLKMAGADSVVAVADDFNHDGVGDLIVANSDGLFTLFFGSANGPQAASTLSLPSLVNIADMVIGSMKSDAVNLYATVNGVEAAFLVTFGLDQSSASLERFVTGGAQVLLAREATLDEPSVDTIGIQEAEYSSLSESPLEIVATLTLGSEAGGSVATVTEVIPSEYADQEIRLIAETDDAPSDLVRESIIAGATDLPIRLNTGEQEEFEAPALDVPFPSPLEWFDSSGQIPFVPQLQQIIDEMSHWNAGGIGNSREMFASEEAMVMTDEHFQAADDSEMGSNQAAVTPIDELSLSDDPWAQCLVGQLAIEPTFQHTEGGGTFSLAFGLGLLFLAHEPPRQHLRANPSRSLPPRD